MNRSLLRGPWAKTKTGGGANERLRYSMRQLHDQMINDAETYKRAIARWASMVISTQGHVETFRAAKHGPLPGPLLRSMTGFYRAEQSRARGRVRSHLLEILSNLDDATFAQDSETLRQLSASAWPEIYRAVALRDEKIPA